jgi:hypothetical protein
MTPFEKTIIAPGKAVYKLPDGDYRIVDTSNWPYEWDYWQTPTSPVPQNREQRRASDRRKKVKGRVRGKRRF